MMPTQQLLTTRRQAAAALGSLSAALLAGCSGIPLTSIPRLLRLSDQLVDAKPAELMLAVQLDGRMAPPPGGVPVMDVTIEPSTPGGFEVIHKKLPMRLISAGDDAQGRATVNNYGLEAARKGRRWLVYSFAPESQAELERLQNNLQRLIQDKKSGSGPGKGGVKISVGIAQDGMATRDPAFANTPWESWLQTKQADGFFELWSGTVGALLKQAGQQPKPSAPTATPTVAR